MDKVKLQVHNKINDETKVLPHLYDRDILEKWLYRQRHEMGAQFHEWTVIELEEEVWVKP